MCSIVLAMPRSAHNHSSPELGGSRGRGRLVAVLCISAGFMFVEAAAGIYTASLALLSDAAHMLADVFALSVALFALWFSRRPSTPTNTFGFHRAEVLAAFFNGVLLLLISAGICAEAYGRFRNPGEIKSLEMTAVASVGLVVNVVGAYLLAGVHAQSLNMRGAFLHVLGDALGSVGAIAAGLIILKTGWVYADSVVSVFVALIIALNSQKLIRESAHILLEGAPKRVNLKSIESEIASHEGVCGVHDLHVWTLAEGFEAMSAHLVIDNIAKSEGIVHEITHRIIEKFGISHITLQVETVKRRSHHDETKRCEMKAPPIYDESV
ncbi:MAG: cation diffusion facilitator family transporter [Deltaproteobacteria bacterium]